MNSASCSNELPAGRRSQRPKSSHAPEGLRGSARFQPPGTVTPRLRALNGRQVKRFASFSEAMVGTRSRAIRDRCPMVNTRCSASDRMHVPARPAQHVHRRVPDLRRRTRRSASTIGDGSADTTIGRADADQAGARPYLRRRRKQC